MRRKVGVACKDKAGGWGDNNGVDVDMVRVGGKDADEGGLGDDG